MSTVSESVTDTTGHVVFTAADIYTSGNSMERISGTAYTFNNHGLLSKVLDTIRTVPGTGAAGEVAINYVYVAGQLTSKTDSDGTQTTYGYNDGDLRNTSITTAADGSGSYPGRTQSFTYNLADLKATAQEDPNSPTVTTYEYEKTGRLKSASQPRPGGGLALVTNYAYPTALQTTVTLPTNATLVTDLYVDGRIKDKVGTGRVPTYYDYATTSYGTIKTTRNGSGSAYPWSEAVTDGLGRVTRVRTPEFGWTSGSNKSLRKISIYSASTGQLISVSTTDESAGMARVLPDHLYHYTDLGRMDQEGDDLNSNGSLDTASTDRIVKHTLSFYVEPIYNGWVRDEATQLYRTINNSSDVTTASETVTRMTRFNNGSMIEGSARVLADVVAYDSSGRYTATTDWSNVSTRVKTRYSVQEGESSAALARSQDGYLKSEQSISGATKTYAYNGEMGMISSVTEGVTNAQTSYQYYTGTNFLWKTTQTTGPSSSTTTTTAYSWDGTTQTTKVAKTDAASTTSYIEYNALGQPWHTWGGGALPSQTGYDSYGRGNSLTTWKSGSFTGSTWPYPGGGDTTSWTIDAASGLASRKTYPNATHVDYLYNARGQASKRTWARGTVTNYGFDSLTGELTGKTYSDATPAVGFTYNRFGALATASDAAGSRTFNYRTDLKLDNEALPAFFGSRTLTQTYDGSIPGRPTGYSFNGNVTVGLTEAFDGLGHLSTVTAILSPASTTFSFGYASGTDLVNSVTNGSFARSLPLVGRYDVLASATTTWGGAERARFVSGSTDARGYRNTFDNGNAGGTPTESWSKKLNLGDGYKQSLVYDGYGRLDLNIQVGTTNPAPSWQNAAGSQSLAARQVDWNYDLANNRTGSNTDWGGATTYNVTDNTGNGAYAALNEYGSITGANNEGNLHYDLDGNLTQDGTWTYSYDAENQLTGMSKSGQTLAFTYDFQGRRIRKVVTGTGALDHKFVWSGWMLATEVLSDGYSIQYSFIWGPDFSNAQGAAGGAGALLGQYSPGWTLTYAVADVQGNIVGQLDTSGNFASAQEFSLYGRQINTYGAVAGYPIGYSGHYTDSETGLVYYGLRYYNPKHGRFINRDPIEEAGGNNLYSFVGNSPTQGWDVLGMDPSPYWVVDTPAHTYTAPDGIMVTTPEKGHMVYPIDMSGEGSDDPVENIFRYGNPQGITGTLTFSMENGDSLVLRLTHLTQDNIQSAMAYYSDVRQEFATARQDVVRHDNAVDDAFSVYFEAIIAANSGEVLGYAGQPPCGVVAVNTLEQHFGKPIRTEADILSYGADSAGGMTSGQVKSVLAADNLTMARHPVSNTAAFQTFMAQDNSALFFTYLRDPTAIGGEVGHWTAAIPNMDSIHSYTIYNYDGAGRNTTETPTQMMDTGGNGPMHSTTGQSGQIWIVKP